MKRKRLLVWAILYGIIANLQYEDALIDYNNITVTQFMTSYLFDMQQFFFVVTVFFLSFLYLQIQPLTSPMVIVRSGKFYFRKQLIRMFKCCVSFWLFALTLYFSIAILGGSQLDLELPLIWNSIRLFLGLCVIYLLYFTLLLFTHQQIASLIGALILNLILSSVLLMGAWVTFDTMTGEILEDFHTPRSELALNIYPIIGMVLILILYKKCKRGDFL